MTISQRHAEWLEGRGISPELAARFGLCTVDGNVLAFPFLDHGRVVNEKFRGPGKKFWQKPGGKRTFWNADALDDPALVNNTAALIITEGEIDALTAIECGFPLTVSVPDGAPPGEANEGEPDPEADKAGKFSFMYHNRDRLKRIKRFVIAVDSDEPGQRLAAELVRRLGAARCAFVTYPDGCKDLNDVLRYHGPEGVSGVLNGCKPYPVRGLYKLSDFPDRPPLQLFSTGFPQLDFNPDDKGRPGLMLYRSGFVVVSGLAGGGKTALTTQIAFNMARIHRWRIAIASFEMHVRPILEVMLMGFFIGKPRAEWNRADRVTAREFIEEHFSFIALTPEDDDTEADVDWVIEKADDSVIRDGIDMALIDPWNEVEHRRRSGESVADYTNRAIRSLRRFAHTRDVCTFVVAHPTKEGAKSVKDGKPMGLYDISDGATWANKAEQGLIVHRASPHDRETLVGIRKIKFHETGRIGDVYLTFDDDLRAFAP
jgi:twinkle protein